MRIAMVSPLFESVPPQLYGGTERVVAYLTEALLKLGHEITLFASGDSSTGAKLIAPCRRALRLDSSCLNDTPHHVLQLEMVEREAKNFDIIHFHTDLLHLPLARRLKTPSVTTMHGRLDIPDLKPLYHEFSEVPLISISDNQRIPLAFANWASTIHHGLPENLLRFHPKCEGYLAFLGRVSPEKRVDRAVEIARSAGKKIKVAAKVDKNDAAYYESIKHLLKEPHVEFIGEITEAEKNDFLGNAEALLFPIDWPEPFGLVMIEAMATGTPVIAYPSGSVPEIVREGKNGFIVSSISQAAEAVNRIGTISRAGCRESFVNRFSSERMAKDHVALYGEIIREKTGAVISLQGRPAEVAATAGWRLG